MLSYSFKRFVSALTHRSPVYTVTVVVSGVLLALSFPFPSIGLLAWIAVVPLLSVLSRSSLKESLIYGFLFGFTFFATVLYWIQIFGYLAWISLSLFLSIWPALFTIGAWWVFVNLRLAGRLIIIPVLWGLTEYGRALGPLGFGWANIGSTVENVHLASIASFVGEIGLGSVIVLSNVLFFELVQYLFKNSANKRERHNLRLGTIKNVGAFFAIIILFATACISGIKTEEDANHKTDSEDRPLSVAIVQPNIPQRLKMNTNNNKRIKAVYMEMTRNIFDNADGLKPDLVIWPESVLLAYADEEKAFYDDMIQLVTNEESGFLYGALSRDNQNNVFNNAFYVDAKRNIAGYQKIHLVPFGEYVPIRWLIKRVNAMSDLVVDKTPGTEHTVFKFKNQLHVRENSKKNDDRKQYNRNYGHGKFSSIICFESADSLLVGAMVRKGSRMVFVLTNDGWFGDSAAPEQHFRISRMRSIEYGVPVVQAANTGVSGVIDGSGRIIAKADINERLVLRGKVLFAKKPSYFAIYGMWLPYIYCLTLFVAIACFIKNRFSIGHEGFLKKYSRVN